MTKGRTLTAETVPERYYLQHKPNIGDKISFHDDRHNEHGQPPEEYVLAVSVTEVDTLRADYKKGFIFLTGYGLNKDSALFFLTLKDIIRIPDEGLLKMFSKLAGEER